MTSLRCPLIAWNTQSSSFSSSDIVPPLDFIVFRRLPCPTLRQSSSLWSAKWSAAMPVRSRRQVLALHLWTGDASRTIHSVTRNSGGYCTLLRVFCAFFVRSSVFAELHKTRNVYDAHR